VTEALCFRRENVLGAIALARAQDPIAFLFFRASLTEP